MSDGASIIVEYTNYRGETSRRTIKPLRMWWGNTEYHTENQWMLTAYDCEKKVERDFAWQDMTPVRNPATSADPSSPLAALAMRERAADKLSEILDGWEVIRKYHKTGSFAGDAAVKSILALPTKFTDAELLAAAMLLPEVRAMVDALSKAEKS